MRGVRAHEGKPRAALASLHYTPASLPARPPRSTLVITFSLLAGGMHSESCEKAAGYVGFFCGASAIYAAFAFLYKAELGISLPGVAPVNYI